MIIESFYQKADLERWLEPALVRQDYQVLMDAIWKPLVEKNLRYEILLMGILTVYKEGVQKYHRGKTAFF
jgi:hypothetical protein